MKYYLVYLWQGSAIDVRRFPTREERFEQREQDRLKLRDFYFQLSWDEVQVVDVPE